MKQAHYPTSTKALKRRVALAAVTAFALTSIPVGAEAAQSTRVAPMSSGPVEPAPSATYGNADIVALFLFGAGPIAAKSPELAKRLVPRAASVSKAQISALTTQLMEQDPHFYQQVTLPLQSGDPYRVQSAIEQFRTDVLSISNGVDKGKANGRCVVASAVFVGTALVVFVAAAVGAAAVLVYAVAWAYVPDGQTGEFDKENLAADLARNL